MYSQIVFTQILSGGSLCGKSCVDELVEILLCEDGDVELCARTSKHIFVFVFGYLSLNSTLIISCIAIIVHLYMLDIVYVLILVLVQESY